MKLCRARRFGISNVATLARAWEISRPVAHGLATVATSGANPVTTPTPNLYEGRNDGLSRLDRGYYRGQAYVHWTITIQDRKTGWLVPIFYYKFRELLTHATFRYSMICPIYCLMPDHMHLF